jgi:hypothetical protein
MSINVLNSNILYGETTVIIITDLTNITITPISSVENITNNNIYTIIVKPLLSTLYIVTGYDIFNNLTTLNITVYVNITVENNNVITMYNKSIKLSAFGSSTYNWYPSTYLNRTDTETVICKPLKDIIYTVLGIDPFLTTTRTYIFVRVDTNLYFIPENPSVYDGNLLKINVNYNNPVVNINSNNITYTWESNLFNNMPANCTTLKHGSSITIHPYRIVEYTVNAYYNNILLSSGTINVNVLPKPMNIIDLDILPYKLYKLIINRNRKQLIKELTKNKVLSYKIIDFYYTTLQTAYRMEWTDKNGINFKVKWLTLYQIVNKSDAMIITFDQQWNFFQYINFNKREKTISNFTYLLNILNGLYLEYVQRISYIQN